MNPHRALAMLVCGYPNSIRTRKLLVMVNLREPATHVAYIDESHGSTSRRLLVLSACVLDYQGWAEFSDAWYRVLHQHPAINAFHMRDARVCRESSPVGTVLMLI